MPKLTVKEVGQFEVPPTFQGAVCFVGSGEPAPNTRLSIWGRPKSAPQFPHKARRLGVTLDLAIWRPIVPFLCHGVTR